MTPVWRLEFQGFGCTVLRPVKAASKHLLSGFTLRRCCGLWLCGQSRRRAGWRTRVDAKQWARTGAHRLVGAASWSASARGACHATLARNSRGESQSPYRNLGGSSGLGGRRSSSRRSAQPHWSPAVGSLGRCDPPIRRSASHCRKANCSPSWMMTGSMLSGNTTFGAKCLDSPDWRGTPRPPGSRGCRTVGG
jgi:hypothetical protein